MRGFWRRQAAMVKLYTAGFCLYCCGCCPSPVLKPRRARRNASNKDYIALLHHHVDFIQSAQV